MSLLMIGFGFGGKMEKSTEAIILFLLNRHYIGARHFPEHKLIVSRTKWLNREERKAFEKEYELFSKQYLIRLKKRTGKSSEWHISMNPEKMKEILDLIDKNEEE